MSGISDADVDELIDRVERSAVLFMRGEMDRYLELIHHAPGYTLTNPLGGAIRRYDDRTESVLEAAGYFRGGDARLEVAEVHRLADAVVLVGIERQHGKVGDLPEQDWSLRVTMVFRREAEDWLLLHRHADFLVHPIELEQAAALARG
jgi:hypothetical protein